MSNDQATRAEQVWFSSSSAAYSQIDTKFQRTMTTSSSLLYHENSPHVILRPTAPACVWRRLCLHHTDAELCVKELSLVGWSYPTVFDRVLPLFRQNVEDYNDDESDGTKNAIRALQVLNIVSTELWVSSQFRSPFSLGVDRVTASLLLSCSRNLQTLCISRGCNKSVQDWESFCLALSSLKCLTRLELLDAANVYAPKSERSQLEEASTSGINVSLLFTALADASIPLKFLKVHLNAYQPGRLSIKAWKKFSQVYDHGLEELSLHMISIHQPHFSKEHIHVAQKSWNLRELHLTFVEFDSDATWEQFWGNGLLQNSKCLHTLSLVSPSMTSCQYKALWKTLFGCMDSNARRLQELVMSASSPNLFRHLNLKNLPFRSPSLPNQEEHGGYSNLMSLPHAQDRIRHTMQSTLSDLLEHWRGMPPGRLLHCELPFHPIDQMMESTQREWVVVENVWNMYQTFPEFNLNDKSELIEVLSNFSDLDTIFHFVSQCGGAVLVSTK